jgi:tRNA nucleotidyltransferase (CCA-adding enzyme)
MSVYQLLDEIAQSLVPRDEVFDILTETINDINDRLSLHQLDAQAMLGGSVAKGTFLRADHDIDVFVRFNYQTYQNENLSELLAEPMKYFSAETVHGSRDYFQFSKQGFDFEVVPVLAIQDASQARNVTDVSPLHVQYMKQQDVDTNQIRLAKQFCKSAGVYGAESFIRGFSGHVLDLLIIEYGSFYELVRAAVSWKTPVVIDSQDHHDHPLVAIEKNKHGPLIIVDPVQPFRNAAAALDEDQLQAFMMRCQQFLRNPSAEFFIIQEFDESQLKSRISTMTAWAMLYATHSSEDKRDVAGARVRKTYERVCDEIERDGFELVDSGWEFKYNQDSVLWFVFDTLQLSKTVRRQGPPVSESEHVIAFTKEHGEVTEENGVLFAEVTREIQTPAQSLTTALKEVTSQTQVDCEIVAAVLQEEDQ